MLDRKNTIQSLKNNKFKKLGDKVFFIKIKELPFVKKINLRLDPYLFYKYYKRKDNVVRSK